LQALADNANIKASSPFVYGQIILKNGPYTLGVITKGIEWNGENRMLGLETLFTKQKDPGFILKDKQLLIGSELARNLGIFSGGEVVLMAPGEFGAIPRMEKFTVANIFHSGMYEYDSSLVFVSLEAAQRLFGIGTNYSGIGITLKNLEDSGRTSGELSKKLGYNFQVRSWESMNRNLFSALKLEKIMMFIILGLIILVAAFNIISNLLLLTVEKAREIGILMAMGFKKKEISRIFLFEGLALGFAGIFSGSILGIGLSLLLKKYKFIHLPGDVYYIDTLPVRLIPLDITMVIACALLITLLSVLYPAREASKMDPLEAIRFG
jgi:lipoprotein-releasing system permease protein